MALDLPQELAARGLVEVDYKEFYRDIFPAGALEKKGIYVDGQYTGIIIELPKPKDGKKQKIWRHTVTDDLDKLDEVVGRDNFCLMSPISYAGKTRHSANARYLYALAIDLDGVTTVDRLDYLFRQFETEPSAWKWIEYYFGVPAPTYLVCSGTGLHLYYVFDNPIPLYPQIVKQLETLKRRITWQAWTQGASELHDSVQYESLFQGFRVVGTVTKQGHRARAYRYGGKVTIEWLNSQVPAEDRAEDFTYKSKLSLDEAKAKYPEWYEKRIVQGRPKGTWTCSRGLYDWWRNRSSEPEEGHRYWYVMTLAVYAKKCGIDYDELVADACGMVEGLDAKGDSFTVEDVMAACEAYNDNYFTYPIDTIVRRTDMPIEKNKRNGRKQAIHVLYMNNQRAFKVGLGECTNGGRPTAKQIVQMWRMKYPDSTKAECIEGTGLSKKTVYKWWNPEAAAKQPQLADESKDDKDADAVTLLAWEMFISIKKGEKNLDDIKSNIVQMDRLTRYMEKLEGLEDASTTAQAELAKYRQALELAEGYLANNKNG